MEANMKPVTQLCILGLLLCGSTAAIAASERGARSATAGAIGSAVVTAANPVDGTMTIEVTGFLTPNREALLVPRIDDGRIQYLALDSAIHVRANSSGVFSGELVIPLGAKGVQLLLVAAHGSILDSMRLYVGPAAGALALVASPALRRMHP
jgi:hypothetical protein